MDVGRWVWRAVLLSLVAWGVALGANPRRAADLHIYVTTARRFWEAAPLYPASDWPFSFKYPPAAGWLFTPLAMLPLRVGGALWNAGSIAAFAWAAKRWAASLDEDGRFSSSALACAGATFALGQSFFLELFYGQVNLWIASLLMLAFASRGRWPAGILVAVASLLKPTAAVALVGLVALRRWRAAASALAWMALLHVPLLLRYGPGGTVAQIRAWSSNLAETTAAWSLGHNPQGLPTLLLSLLHPLDAPVPHRSLAIAELASAAGLLCAALAWRLRGAALWSLLCLVAAFVSPLAWRANFVLAWPLLLALLSLPGRRERRVASAVVALVALVELIVSEAVLGAQRARAVLAWRPWAVAFLLVVAAALWVLPKGDAPGEVPVPPEPGRPA